MGISIFTNSWWSYEITKAVTLLTNLLLLPRRCVPGPWLLLGHVGMWPCQWWPQCCRHITMVAIDWLQQSQTTWHVVYNSFLIFYVPHQKKIIKYMVALSVIVANIVSNSRLEEWSRSSPGRFQGFIASKRQHAKTGYSARSGQRWVVAPHASYTPISQSLIGTVYKQLTLLTKKWFIKK